MNSVTSFLFYAKYCARNEKTRCRFQTLLDFAYSLD
jgi:hypothetical protein